MVVERVVVWGWVLRRRVGAAVVCLGFGVSGVCREVWMCAVGYEDVGVRRGLVDLSLRSTADEHIFF